MTNEHALMKRWGIGLLSMITALILLLGFAPGVFANTVNIYDAARVLNQEQVRKAASALPYPVSIYTVNGYNGSVTSFDTLVNSRVVSDNMIVIGIDTTGHVYVTGGPSVPLSTSDYQQAAGVFASAMRGNGRNFTGATVGALGSLNSSLGASSVGGTVLESKGSSGFGGGALACVGLLALAAIAFFVITRRRTIPGLGGAFGRGGTAPYTQGNRGMNPWAAGGLGAAAGGLAGYEMGRRAGERGPGAQPHEGQGGMPGPGAGSDFGAGSRGTGGSADWGNRDRGDTGGGGADWGNKEKDNRGGSGGGAGSNF